MDKKTIIKNKVKAVLKYNNLLYEFCDNLVKNKYIKKSYSQCGEDIVVEFVLHNYFGIDNPSYLDIGAHHPVYLSNTHLFYLKGARGVCIEPDPNLFRQIKKIRKNDLCLNIGVSTRHETKADFYVMSSKTLSTFVKEEAERFLGYGNQKIEKVLSIRLETINDIINNYFDKCPDFVSIDVEGLDFEILQSLDFARYRPKVFCIETITHSTNKTGRKINEIMDFMQDKGYSVYADTNINTIFIDKEDNYLN